MPRKKFTHIDILLGYGFKKFSKIVVVWDAFEVSFLIMGFLVRTCTLQRTTENGQCKLINYIKSNNRMTMRINLLTGCKNFLTLASQLG